MIRQRDGVAALRDLRTLFTVGGAGGLTDGQLLERFTARRGEAAEGAFATLVERHGRMVYLACREILRDEHEAQDAFQATFLALARSGRSLWVRDSLGPWLHRVACRAAVRSRRASGRRLRAERLAAETSGRSTPGAKDGEVVGALHEEIDRLPERFRAPVVLCDLEGRSYEEAARHLGCPVGTVKSRLARGRERLRCELARRGLAPSGMAPGAAVAPGGPATVLPAALESASRSAWAVVSSGRGAAPEAVGALADGVLRSLALARWRWAVVLTLAVAGAGVEARRVVGQGTPAERASGSRAAVAPFDEVRVVGDLRVVISPGPESRFSVVGGPPAQAARLRSKVEARAKGGRLVLELPPRDGEAGGGGQGGVDRFEVRVTTPRLSGVVAEGRSVVVVEGREAPTLALTVSDSAKLEASGTIKGLSVILGDEARLDASRLAVEDAQVTASGHSSGIVRPKGTLSVLSNGDARVESIGAPRQVNKLTSDRSLLIVR